MTMHKAHLTSVVLAAYEGHHVLVASTTHGAVRAILDDLVGLCNELQLGLIQQVSRTNGGERIDLVTGGGIRFAVTHGNQRRLDRSVYDQAFVPLGVDEDFLLALIPALQHSPVGLITGY